LDLKWIFDGLEWLGCRETSPDEGLSLGGFLRYFISGFSGIDDFFFE
jgi:hypothetical protein